MNGAGWASRRRVLTVFAVATLVASACGGTNAADTASSNQAATPPATSTPAPEAATDTPAVSTDVEDTGAADEPAQEQPAEEVDAEEPVEEDEPVEEEPAEAEPSEVVEAAAEPRPVQFETPDGEVLAGAVFGESQVGIVLAHMRGADKTTWYPFARNAAQAGYMALAFDFRGYGDSTGQRDTDLDVDVIAAVGLLRAEGATRIVVMGASMGATAAVNVASRLNLAAAVSISAPGEFIGLQATGVAGDVEEPLLIIAAENDHPYVDAAIEIDALAPITQLQILAGNAHGTNLFVQYDAELTKLLLDFVSARAG